MKMEAEKIDELKEIRQKHPFIGRKSEISKCIEVLVRKKKRNIILIGNPGSGKRAIVERLSELSNTNQIPYFNKKFFELDVMELKSGTKFRGELEQKINPISERIIGENGVMVVYGLDMMVGKSESENSDLLGFFKDKVKNGLQCIITCNQDDWNRYKNENKSFINLFQEIYLKDTTVEETIEILKGIQAEYEDFHNVVFSESMFKDLVVLSEKYLPRSLPDKAIDLMDQVSASVKLFNTDSGELSKMESLRSLYIAEANYEEALKLTKEIKEKFNNPTSERVNIVYDHIAAVIERITGIPISSMEDNDLDNLQQLANKIKAEVKGQDHAVNSVVRNLQRYRLGIADQNKPLSFLMIGPTGVGKTELAKSLARNYFGKDRFFRLDMSEYNDEASINNLIGVSAGYVGNKEGGKLTNYVASNPFCLILLDEVEKAHPSIYDIFLQVLDEGILTDKNGTKVNFKNTIIIMSSNIGVKESKQKGPSVGFTQQTDNKDLSKYLYKYFRVEFINRIGEILYFNSIDKSILSEIMESKLTGLLDRCKRAGFDIELDDKAKDLILEKGFNPEMGARPLNSAIDLLEKTIADEYLNKRNLKFKISSNENQFVNVY